MSIQSERYLRKPLYVDAVRVSSENFEEIARWCQGDVQLEAEPGAKLGKKYIKVRVHNPKNPRQTKAFIGDWLLYTERGYKVYTSKAFHSAFDKVDIEHVPDSATAEKEIDDIVTADEQIALVPATPEALAEAVFNNEKAREALDAQADLENEKARVASDLDSQVGLSGDGEPDEETPSGEALIESHEN